MSAWKVETRRHESGHAVHLIVGVQSFALPCGDGTRDEAEWWAEKLRHAILAIERGVLDHALDAGIAAGRESDTNGEAYAATLARIRALITSRLPSCSGCEPGSEGTHAEGTRQHP